MKFAFLHIGDDARAEQITEKMISSVRNTHPDAEIWQMSDKDTGTIKGSDKVLRLSQPMPLMPARLALSSFFDEAIFLDTDIIVQKNLYHVFEHDFDVALVRRRGKYRLGKKMVAKTMPYNAGVAFSRNKKFWKDCFDYCSKLPKNEQDWFGDQYAIDAIVKTRRYKVLNLDSRYNFTPKSREEDVSGNFIVHYKGNRKDWM